MKTISKTSLLLTLGCTALVIASNAFAQAPVGTVGYVPVITPATPAIPSLSGVMLIVLGLIFAVLAYRALRTSPGGKPLASIVALVIIGLGAAGAGTELIQNTMAACTGSGDPDMCSATGGTVGVATANANVQILNTSGQKQKITTITPSQGLFECGNPANNPLQCVANQTVVPNGGFCTVNFCGG